MPTIVARLTELPVGAHCLGIHVGEAEGAAQAADFVAGAPDRQPASFWVSDERRQQEYRETMGRVSPQQVGCVAVLPSEQVAPVAGVLRPVDEISRFVAGHPEGVTAGADTIDRHWTAATIPDYLEYEEWFESQRGDRSRFLCPYDLRRIPPEAAPELLRGLGSHHSHVVLSENPEPAVRLLELFIFGRPDALPPALEPTLAWARARGYLGAGRAEEEFSLTPEGERLIRAWSDSTEVDW